MYYYRDRDRDRDRDRVVIFVFMRVCLVLLACTSLLCCCRSSCYPVVQVSCCLELCVSTSRHLDRDAAALRSVGDQFKA